MNILNHILRVIVGATFVFSGVAKLFPIEPFEIVFVDFGIENFFIASIIARFIIAFEIFLGFSIIFDSWFKDIIYKLTLTSLGLFSTYLVYLLVTKGNSDDCGCFGSWFAFSPIESLIKNVVLVLMLLFIKRRYHVNGGFIFLPGVFLIVAFTSTFLLNRIGLHNLQGIEVNERIDYSRLPVEYKSNKKVDFSKGNKMIAFFSNSCSHCLNASRIFTSITKGKEVDNLYYVVGAKTEKSLNDFLDKSDNELPVIWINGDEFFKYSGGRLPAIVYLEDGIIKKKWFGDLFDVDEVKMYLE